MKYIIDEEVLYNGIDAEVSTAADMAYDKNGNPLFDGIILTEKDGPLVKNIIHDAGSRLVGRMADIAKFSADVEETTTNSGGRRFMAAPVLRANTEQIIINDPQWGAGKAALSAKSILLTPGAQSVLVGYKNPKQGYKRYYSENTDWLTIADTEVDGKPYFRISVTENTTGAQRFGKFWLEYYARDYWGELRQFLGISVNVTQAAEEGAIVTIQIPDDSDILSNEEYYSAGYEYRRVTFVSTTKSVAIEYTGGTKLIPITFSDGSTFLQKLQAGDVTIVDEWSAAADAWCHVTPVEGGLVVDCEAARGRNNFVTSGPTPYEDVQFSRHSFKISFKNVLNQSVVDYDIIQRAIPLGASGVDPYAIPFRIGHSTMFAFDAEGGEQSETISSTTGTFTLTQNNASEYPDWLTVSISADYKKITYTCTPNNTGEPRKFWASYTAHKVGSDETATFGTFIEQYYSNEHPDLGLSATPAEITFGRDFDASDAEYKYIELNIPEGYRARGYKTDGDFFTVKQVQPGWLKATLTSTNDTGAKKIGQITICLTDYNGNDVNAKPFFVTVTQGYQTSGESPVISSNPGRTNKFHFGFNGAERAFTKFWYAGGEVSFTFDYGNQPAWFRLKKADKYVNTDQSNGKVNYNPFGYYVECDANTTGEERNGVINALLTGWGGSKETHPILVHQAGGNDIDKPVPIIYCDNPTVPASGTGTDGSVSIFVPITFTNVNDYEINLLPNSFIKSYSERSGGIEIVCSRNEGAERDTTFAIVARNEYNTSTMSVTVTQQGASEQTPVEPDLYLKANRTNIVIKSTNPQTEIIKINTNCDSVYAYIEAENSTDNPLYDDWAYAYDDELDPIVLGDNEFAFDFDDNETGEERTCTITFSNIEHGMEMDEEVVVSDVVTIKQLKVPGVSLAYNSTNISWEGGRVSVPISIVGLQYKDLKVSGIGAAAVATIDMNGNLVVEVSQNNYDYAPEHEIEIKGLNQLDEEATATLVIKQGVKPIYTGDDTELDEGGSGDGGSSTSGSGKDAIEFDVPDFDLNELLGTAYNKEGLFKEISRYFILFTCMKIFQERYADLVPIYTERAQAAMDNINNIIRQRKRPKRR